MKPAHSVLVINSSFREVNHLAAALAERGLLSSYVRPYANLGRGWEVALSSMPGAGKAYGRTFGRRRMPEPLGVGNVREAAIVLDLLMAVHFRLPFKGKLYHGLRKKLMYGIGDAIARAGARVLTDESVVAASWWCALPAFERAARRGATRVLNYPLAHHAFTRRYLQEEAELEPSFAGTLNSHDFTSRQIAQLDREIELADYVLAGSSFAKSSFVAEGVPEEKLVAITYGVDTSLFSPPAERKANKRFNIIFAGQLGQRKGISYLLRAYERIHGMDTALTLVGEVQGDGKPFAPWRHLFRHIQHVPQQELARLFQQSDVLLFPTLVEGMGLVVVEAMASGLPVITTPNGQEDIVRDGVDGFIVPPRDVDALVDRMETLRSDSELREWMSENATERAREFTWAKYRQNVVAFIERVFRDSAA